MDKSHFALVLIDLETVILSFTSERERILKTDKSPVVLLGL